MVHLPRPRSGKTARDIDAAKVDNENLLCFETREHKVALAIKNQRNPSAQTQEKRMLLDYGADVNAQGG